jgi:hypothetical protein
MLLFQGNDGRFVSQVAFSTDELPETPLTPGKYILLTKFNPNHPELPSTLIQDDPKFLKHSSPLRPANCCTSTEVRHCWHSKPTPALYWNLQATIVPILEGQEIFMAQGLQIRIQLPPDLADEELTLRIRSKTLGQSIDLPMNATLRHDFTIDLRRTSVGLESGCIPNCCRMQKIFITANLARTSAVLWNGLKT